MTDPAKPECPADMVKLVETFLLRAIGFARGTIPLDMIQSAENNLKDAIAALAKDAETYRAVRSILSSGDVCGTDDHEIFDAEMLAESRKLATDAARYRWLRAQTWDTGELAVVTYPKAAIKLGYDAPCYTRLDEAIDAAIKEAGK